MKTLISSPAINANLASGVVARVGKRVGWLFSNS